MKHHISYLIFVLSICLWKCVSWLLYPTESEMGRESIFVKDPLGLLFDNPTPSYNKSAQLLLDKTPVLPE